VAPQITGDEAFYEFLFSGTPGGFAAVRAKAEAGEALPPATLANVRVSVSINNTYEVLTT
jgi:hypothetical protein